MVDGESPSDLRTPINQFSDMSVSRILACVFRSEDGLITHNFYASGFLQGCNPGREEYWAVHAMKIYEAW
eukprot:CAMPEP_0113952604 /NCGR_PEP_ID=MMETSP1339-20121228/90516_1 /TAXON_ID=94617 /ORGANISM="Fibrocapsa japonica" /LENGTH=69 /DNA_ID=CAMNT_0000961249 /DNA_START=505 /DNA_END=711 /DNA_ORIENTATION=- /assembly_acc=CAM_ASM_000762